ncbi:DUF6489 family protein [Sneathiella glossodoripedis]|uniref:DUF6489 family protein n=1 Tax=Sneathiella glossodoripedis TaxID=418853 RepID=UPI00046EAE34|nr:DUF6489 family protein [Sneathiella glossodoripedis]
MKINLDIECTPEEARKFFGLPDVEPMQQALMAEIQKKMMENINNLDAENMMKNWLPASMKGFDQMQNMFWNSFTQDKSDKKD